MIDAKTYNKLREDVTYALQFNIARYIDNAPDPDMKLPLLIAVCSAALGALGQEVNKVLKVATEGDEPPDELILITSLVAARYATIRRADLEAAFQQAITDFNILREADRI